MRQNITRAAAILASLAVVAAGCSSSHHRSAPSTTVFPTTATPTTGVGSVTTRPGPTTTGKGHPATRPGGSGGRGSVAGGGSGGNGGNGGNGQGPGGTTKPGSPTTTVVSGTTPPGSPTTTTAKPTAPFFMGVGQRWKLALDYRTHPAHNPFSSYLGGPAVWSLREGQTLARNGNYPLLPTFSSTFGTPGIAAWHDSASGCPSRPAIGVDVSGTGEVVCSAGIPGGAAFLDPTSSHSAVVAWTSPFTGAVNISHNAVADLDGTCGDGVSYFVELGTQQVSAVRLTNNNAAELPEMRERIAKGQSLYFIVDPGIGDNAACDITQLQITIDRVA